MRDDPWTAANPDKEQQKVMKGCDGIASVQANSRDRSGPVNNLRPMFQSLKASSRRDNEQMNERASSLLLWLDCHGAAF
jgi:hypothetical protein